MAKVFCWLIVLGALYYVYQAGWFNGIVEYFQDASKYSKQEKIIHHEDGSYSTIEYKNVFDLLLGK